MCGYERQLVDLMSECKCMSGVVVAAQLARWRSLAAMPSSAPRWKRRRRKSPRRPLRWGAGFLPNLIQRMFQNMDTPVFNLLVQFVTAQTIVWGSGCSGSEVPAFVMCALVEAFRQLDVEARQFHTFSAEWETTKQEWIDLIVGESSKAFIFKDIFDLTREQASSFRHGLVTGLPELLSDHICFLCGFSCRIVSTLHTSGELSDVKGETIDEMVGSTGKRNADRCCYSELCDGLAG